MRTSLSRAPITVLAAIGLLTACGPPKAIDSSEVLRNISDYAGRRIVMRTKFRSGARCHQTGESWQTYCKDCQFCKGPIVVDTGGELPENADDWPMILGGTYKNQDIRCKGPLDKIECYPFTPGKTYVIQGKVENQRPPKLLVEKFWEVD